MSTELAETIMQQKEEHAYRTIERLFNLQIEAITAEPEHAHSLGFTPSDAAHMIGTANASLLAGLAGNTESNTPLTKQQIKTLKQLVDDLKYSLDNNIRSFLMR